MLAGMQVSARERRPLVSQNGGHMALDSSGRTRLRAAISAMAIAAALAVGGIAGGAASGAQGIPLTQRVLRSGELPGYTVSAPPAIVFDAKKFAGQLHDPSQAAPLARAGFQRGIYERLAGKGGAQAFSLVIQYKSPAAARSEVARRYREDSKTKGATARTVALTGVRGGKAYTLTYAQPPAQASVVFADGPYMYFLTVLSPDAAKPPLLTRVLATTKALHARTQGKGEPAG